MQMSAAATCGLLLVASNIFMTFAWYAHLRNLAEKPWWIAALASWGIALFEYLLMVPANRIGYTELSLAQLKMDQPVKLDYLWAALCIMGAVYFIFRG